LLNVDLASNLTFRLNVSGWLDRSDTTAAQLLSITISDPGSCSPTRASYPLQCIKPELAAVPLAGNARAADWDPNQDYRRNDHFYLASGRFDWELPAVTLTSLTSSEGFRERAPTDGDGTPYVIGFGLEQADIATLYQEFRVTNPGTGPLHWIAGANAERDMIGQNSYGRYSDGTSVYAISPSTPVLSSNQWGNTEIKTYAGFGNVDYTFNDHFTGHLGARYTSSNIDFVGGHRDTCDGTFAAAFNLVDYAFSGHPGDIQPCGNFVITLISDPKSPTGFDVSNAPTARTLDQSNVSWRTGLDFAATPDLLFYGNISRGYKAGSIQPGSNSSSVQFQPAKQEELLAFELGQKATLLENTLQLNSAVFYYDYKDKQLEGRILDPTGVFGALGALVNVPKSRVIGAEFQATYRPIRALTLSLAGTYLDTEVTSDFKNYDPFGHLINFKGLSFPLTSKVSAVADAEYKWPLRSHVDAFIGSNVKYQSSQDTAFNIPSVIATEPTDPSNAPGRTARPDLFEIRGYAVLDARAGLSSSDSKWRAMLWVRNLTDKYYLSYDSRGLDTVSGYSGMPRTYGVAYSYRF
jgi:outer membrane receptor protein involved in Fe transport